MTKPWPRLWAITDASLADEVIAARAEAACAAVGPALVVHLRDKARAKDALRPLALELRRITRAHGAMLVVGDRRTLAEDVGADGFHGPCEGPPPAGMRWSLPAHDDEEARAAAARGAHAILVSPIFATPGKGTPRGVDAIASARAAAPGLAVYALGGVKAENAAECVRAGADGVAAIRAIFGAEDAGAAARALLEAAAREVGR